MRSNGTLTEWTVPKNLWRDQTVFIFCGGPSLATQRTERLEGRATIAVNRSYERHPWASYVFSGDPRFMNLHKDYLTRHWHERAITVARGAAWPGLLVLKKYQPPGLSTDPRGVKMRWTSTQGAINVATLAGAKRIVLLGLDQKNDDEGRTHHHEPHPWAQVAGCFEKQSRDLKGTTAALAEMGVEVLNASPGSACKLWPITTLDEVLAAEKRT